jgi:hypothetical protein
VAIRRLLLGLALSGPALISCAPPSPVCGLTDVSGRQVQYCLSGSGATTVVLEADAGATHAAWDSVAPRIARFARVLSYDRLGLGASDSAVTLRTLDNVAGELEALLGALGIQGPLVLVGHRHGGWYLRSFAAHRQAEIRRLILVDSPHEEFETRVRALLTEEQRQQLDSAVVARRAQLPPGARQEHEQLAGARPPALLDVPVTMLRGGRHPLPIPSPAAAEALWRTLHDDSLARFTFDARLIDVGAAIRLERPDSLVRVIETAVEPGSWLPRILSGLWGWLWYNAKLVWTGLIAALVTPSLILFFRRRGRERQIRKDPEQIHIRELVPRGKLPVDRRVNALELLRKVNQWAMDRNGTGDHPTAPKIERLWGPIFRDAWEAQERFVEPTGWVYEGSRREPLQGMGRVRAWLAACRNQPSTTADDHITVESPGGAGKTTFIHRLFFDLAAVAARDPAAAVPMLASVANLKSDADTTAGIARSELTPLRGFVAQWLRNRGIVVPAGQIERLLQDFEGALRRGDIILLFDGYDELLGNSALVNRVDQALASVRCCVITRRHDHTAGIRKWHRWILIDHHWNDDQIRAHLERHERWRDAPGARTQLLDAIGRAMGREAAGQDPWLRLPRNLNDFLATLDPADLPPWNELLSRCRSAPQAFRPIVHQAIRRLGRTEVSEQLLQERLFQLAVHQRYQEAHRIRQDQRPLPPIPADDDIGTLVRAMGELFTVETGRPPLFRHAALRDYFASGRMTWELLHRWQSRPEETDALVLFGDERWSPSQIATMADWLTALDHSLTPGTACGIVSRWLGDQQLWPGPHLRRTPSLVRNLLELLLVLELQARADHDRPIRLDALDLSRIAGEQLDFTRFEVRDSVFEQARLARADFTYTRFLRCRFAGADLTGADAVGALFDHCEFGAGEQHAVVAGLEIQAVEFEPGGAAIADELCRRGASRKRSRYRGEFGRSFAQDQAAYLGRGVNRLEDQHYLPAIEAAITPRAPRERPVYLIDLMAGGSYRRVSHLLGAHPQLHILGVDRDPCQRELGPRLQWHQVELGTTDTRRGNELTVDLNALLQAGFGAQARADVVVAKKALHELERVLQPSLIQRAAEALRPGGRLILFVDAPGPARDTPGELPGLLEGHEALRSFLMQERDPARVLKRLGALRFEASDAGRLLFSNLWIMVKDWANLNLHELEHRWFASVAEIRDWARPAFGDPAAISFDSYRLNPLIFNELGIQQVLHYLEREGKQPAVVERDLVKLAHWMAGDEAHRVLVDFTRLQLPAGSPLATALNAAPESIRLAPIDPLLAPLESGETAPAFDLTCAVLVFERP